MKIVTNYILFWAQVTNLRQRSELMSLEDLINFVR